MCSPPSATTSSCSLSVCCLESGEDRVPLLRSATIGCRGSRSLLSAQTLLGHEFGVAAEQNIGTAAGHVGGNRDRAFASGLRDDGGFALVILGVQNFVPDAHFLENSGKPLGLFDRDGTHQNRLALLVQFLDFLGGVAEFFFFGAIDNVLEFRARCIGRLVGIGVTSSL